ncbi:MAG: ankyrin repeat domain-containing protein [Candidatus Dependentiae bacterium]|nr:ankyrin repeat domain-containing protein [Candidatus Dependentiae bacterium]
MKKLLLILCILSNSMQIFCSYKESTSQELDFEALKPKIILAINNEIGLEEITKIKNLNPNLFSHFINKHHGDKYGHTFLQDAIISNNSEKIQRLIYLGADVNQEDNDGKTPLHHAALSDTDEIIRLLICAKANINHKDNYGDTPLHNASNRAVELLIAAGADINQQNIYGETPLYCAAGRSAFKIITLLISAGADITIKDNVFRRTARDKICHIKERKWKEPDYITLKIFDLAVTQRKEKLAAATKIQALARGFLARENLKNEIEN